MEIRKNKNKTQWIYIGSIIAITVAIAILLTCKGQLAGSNVDWISQHTVFPDYFRKLFYKTHNFFPQYAAEIGGGQNIYNFAYYGLANPTYWLSYLFPFISMQTWIQMISIGGIAANGLLCFAWLKHHFEETYSFFAAIALMLALPVIYNSTTQIMFVNYLPFFLMMLIGMDQRMENGTYGLLIIGTLCVVLTSFYFVPACLIALAVYVFRDWGKQQLSSFSVLWKGLWKAFFPVFLGGMLSLFYLVPVFLSMASGRSSRKKVTAADLLLPDLLLEKYLYSVFGLGITAIGIIILCTSFFYGKSEERRMASWLAVIFSLPIVPWILNGGLYIREKVFIPFLPVLCFLYASFFQKMGKRLLARRQVIFGYSIAAIVLMTGAQLAKNVSNMEKGLLLLDLFLCGICLVLAFRCWKEAVAVMMTVAMIGACVVEIKVTEYQRTTKNFAEKLENEDVKNAIALAVEQSEGRYRVETRGDSSYEKANQNRVEMIGQNLTTCYSSVSNYEYQQFRSELGISKERSNRLMLEAVDNPLFLRFMGVRYLVGERKVDEYDAIKTIGQTTLYENQHVAPMFYLTTQTITEEQFQQLSWQEKQLALMEAAVAGETKGAETTKPSKVDISIKKKKETFGKSVWWKGKFYINTSKKLNNSFLLSEEMKEDGYLFLSFKVKNRRPRQEVSIVVDGVRNRLSKRASSYYNGNEEFHYTFAVEKGTKELSVEFKEGAYQISDIQCQFGQIDQKKNQELYQSPVTLSVTKSGNGYEGQIDANESSWLITSIPYDKAFTLYVDGKEVETQLVNGAFLGAFLKSGTHTIQLLYNAEGSKLGVALTACTVLVVIGMEWKRRRKIV